MKTLRSGLGFIREEITPARKKYLNELEGLGDRPLHLLFCNFNSMSKSYDALSKAKEHNKKSIKILDRKIIINKSSEGTIWFNFDEICSSPRSSADYIEIAKEFHNVLISDVPIIESDDEARRFISLIDECYDRKVKIIMSAETDFTALYTRSKLIEKYKRTISRLIEMQSKDYLSEPHKT